MVYITSILLLQDLSTLSVVDHIRPLIIYTYIYLSIFICLSVCLFLLLHIHIYIYIYIYMHICIHKNAGLIFMENSVCQKSLVRGAFGFHTCRVKQIFYTGKKMQILIWKLEDLIKLRIHNSRNISCNKMVETREGLTAKKQKHFTRSYWWWVVRVEWFTN